MDSIRYVCYKVKSCAVGLSVIECKTWSEVTCDTASKVTVRMITIDTVRGINLYIYDLSFSFILVDYSS